MKFTILHKRSIRSILTVLEFSALITALIIFFISSNITRHHIKKDFIARKASELSAIDQLLHERIVRSQNSIEHFAVAPRQDLIPFMDAISDIYCIDETGEILQIFKKSPSSILFSGYKFTGPILELIGSSNPSSEWNPRIIRSPEDERPSLYFLYSGCEGHLLGRMELDTLRDDIHRLVSFDGTIVLLVDNEGLPLTNIGGSVPAQIIRAETGDTYYLGEKQFIVSKAPCSLKDIYLVLLTPAEQVLNFQIYVDMFFLLGFILFSLLMAARLFIFDIFFMSPFHSFIQSLDSWSPEHTLPEIPRITSGVTEIETLASVFTNKATEIKTLNDSLEQKVADRTNQLTHALDKIMVSEKLAVLGRMAAGIAHELNTPLAAIISTTENLNTSYDELVHIIHDVLITKELNEIEFLNELLACSGNTENTRKQMKVFINELKVRDIHNAQIIADDLFDIGIALDDPDLPDKIAHLKSPGQIVKAAYSVCMIGKNAKVIHTAAHRAALTIRAIKLWVYKDTREETVISIREAIKTILTLYYNQTKSNTKIQLNFKDPGWIRGNPEQLNGLWVNLINNALQAMEAGGKLTIGIEREKAPSLMIRVTIEDTGIGIPAELQEKIFTPFFTTKLKGSGTGIGLDLSKRIVEAHGGTIGFTSEVGHTVFWVRLPAAEDSQMVI